MAGVENNYQRSKETVHFLLLITMFLWNSTFSNFKKNIGSLNGVSSFNSMQCSPYFARCIGMLGSANASLLLIKNFLNSFACYVDKFSHPPRYISHKNLGSSTDPVPVFMSHTVISSCGKDSITSPIGAKTPISVSFLTHTS